MAYDWYYLSAAAAAAVVAARMHWSPSTLSPQTCPASLVPAVGNGKVSGHCDDCILHLVPRKLLPSHSSSTVLLLPVLLLPALPLPVLLLTEPLLPVLSRPVPLEC